MKLFVDDSVLIFVMILWIVIGLIGIGVLVVVWVFVYLMWYILMLFGKVVCVVDEIVGGLLDNWIDVDLYDEFGWLFGVLVMMDW